MRRARRGLGCAGWGVWGLSGYSKRTDLRTGMSAGPVLGRCRVPSPRPRRSVPPGRRNPRSYGRRRAGRWPRPRAGERTRQSNTPSKVIRSAMPAGALHLASLSTGCRPLPVDNSCGLPAGKTSPRFFSYTPGGSRFACSRGISCCWLCRLHSDVPRLRTTWPACLHTLSTPLSTL